MRAVRVAGLVVLAMTATLASAQTVEVKEKPRLSRYDSYCVFPRAHWGDVKEENAAGSQMILAPALADGTLVGYATPLRRPWPSPWGQRNSHHHSEDT